MSSTLLRSNTRMCVVQLSNTTISDRRQRRCHGTRSPPHIRVHNIAHDIGRRHDVSMEGET